MDLNLHIQLENLTEKINRMSHMGLTKEEFMNGFTKAETDVLEKALVHKYLRKEGDRYIYDEPKNAPLSSKQEVAVSGLKEKYNEDYSVRHLGSGMHEVLFENGKKHRLDKDGSEPKRPDKQTRYMKGTPNHFVEESIQKFRDKINSEADKKSNNRNTPIVLKEGLTFSIGEQSGGGEVTARIIKVDGDKYTIETFTKDEHKSNHTFGEDDIRDLIEEGGYKIKKSEDNTIDNDDVEKGGEGSRGGRVIGHTKSGKPVYDKASHSGHSDFDYKDHLDAAKLNKDQERDSESEVDKKRFREDAAHHNSMSAVKDKHTVNMYNHWR